MNESKEKCNEIAMEMDDESEIEMDFEIENDIEVKPSTSAGSRKDSRYLSSDTTSSDIKESTDDLTEGNLIQKFVHGETELPDIYTKFESDDEEDEDEDDDEEDEDDDDDDDDNDYDVIDDNKLYNITSDDDAFKITNLKKISLEKCKDGKQTAAGSTADENVVGRKSNKIAGKQHQRGCRRRSVLNAALQGLMGEANLSYARGQIERAEKICLEIVRQNPLAAEPFFTLAEIYESSDTEKFLNFLTIAIHLNPSDRYQWIRIAEIHIEQGNLKRARLYYNRAIKVHWKDFDLRWRKARLLEKMGEQSAAMKAYFGLIRYVPLEKGDLCLATAKMVAQYYHNLKKFHIAMKAMENAFKVCGNIFTLEDLNIYCEYLLMNQKYEDVIQCLKRNADLEIEFITMDNLEVHIQTCAIPDTYVPDIRSKLFVAILGMKVNNFNATIIENMHEHIPIVEDRMDLYIDVAEAFMREHKYEEARSLLKPITDNEQIECPPFVWLRHADCLRHMNCVNEAIDSYSKVVRMAPYCYEAKFTLSALLKQQGRHLEAVKALEQNTDGNDDQPLHARLLYERCLMLQQLNNIDEFLEVGCALLGRTSIKLRSRREMQAVASGGSIYNADTLKAIMQMRNTFDSETEKPIEVSQTAKADDPSVHDEYQLFLELLRTAFQYGKYSIIERMCFSMVTTKRFSDYHKDLEHIMVLACYFNNDSTIAFSYLRELLHKNCNHIPLWNFLSLLIQKGNHLRIHRYILRLISRQPSARNLRIFCAHYYTYCSSYKYALNMYIPIFKEQQHPFVALCIATIFSQISMQKRVFRKCAAVSQALVFAHKYAELRCTDLSLTDSYPKDKYQNSAAGQEVNYNIARIYHQAGIMYLAIEYYERALNSRHPLIEQHADVLSLQQEIAYNLHLIYKSIGNYNKARQYLYEYCVV